MKEKIPESISGRGLYIASQLISSSIYSSFMKQRIVDMEIINKKEREIARTTLDTTGNATILIEEDTTISYANHDFEILSGFSKADIEDQKSFTEFVLEEDLDRMLEYHRLRRISSSKAPRNYEFTFIDRNKKLKYIYMTIDMVPGTSLSIGSFMNITERKRLESEIINISEMERQQVGRDLHDGLGPHLLGIKFMVNTLKQHVEKEKVPKIDDVNEIYDALSEAIDHTRRIMKGMRPVIQAEDFIYSINDMVINVEKLFNIKCKLTCNDFRIRENIIATHLYYIAQEAMNNAVKHGEAENISVKFFYDNDSLLLEVKDDGIGVPKLPDTVRGMGINIMNYRAGILKSKVDIKRRPEGGTCVSMVVAGHSAIEGV
jgi:PAS domain S-box-containing protein